MILEIAMRPHDVEYTRNDGENHCVFVVFIIVEGCIVDVLWPGVACKSSHWVISTNND